MESLPDSVETLRVSDTIICNLFGPFYGVLSLKSLGAALTLNVLTHDLTMKSLETLLQLGRLTDALTLKRLLHKLELIEEA